ncbi:ABC transporter substrate-binding protein [Novosphingobium sp.]|uniref:ABC transporter substrate-binding protein n=1 Tax=Novosphingobium sp. TaxID=1874826 RepID=UPI002FDA7E9B
MRIMRKAVLVIAVLAAVPLAGCRGSGGATLDVAVVGASDELFKGSVKLATAGQLVRAATAEGLVAFDEQGRVVPALADRWIVTDDGQSYIFRLRDGNWANGDPITAESAKKALDIALDALDDTPLALDLSGIDEIRVMAGRVVELRLKRPMPYLLQLLAQPELGLYNDKRGAGPMALRRVREAARLTPIDPSRLGMPAIEDWDKRTRQIELHAQSGAEAVNAFNDGAVDLVLGGRIQDFLLTRSVGILRGTIKLDPVIGLFGLQVMNDRGFLADPANREALAMAIDREALMAPFGVGGWSPSSRIVTGGLEGDLGTIGERWGGQTMDDRRRVSATRVRAWLSGGGKAGAGAKQTGMKSADSVALQVWLPEGQGSQVLFDHLARDFRAVGVSLSRASNAKAADLALVDDVARYPRAAWFLNRLSCRAGRGLCSQDADARVAEADKADSLGERAALLAEAEAELTAANVFIPFGTPIRWSLVRGSVNGFAANAWGWHPLMPLAWLPR